MTRLALSLLLLLLTLPPLPAYSVLTHESVIDAVWDREFTAALKARYPNATPEELKEAHAYAYGGSLAQDMGYYPFSDKLFSDLVHYVRTGDYIRALLRDARDLNEYSFALGALAHYTGDVYGHPLGVNPAVALMYPKLGRRYHGRVTYEDNPKRHLQAEFAFDVVQLANRRYAPDAYHDFIGFKVARRVLAQAFEDTYGLPLSIVIENQDLAIGTVRFSVNNVIPMMTKVAWATKRKEIEKASPGITRSRFLYRMKRIGYEKEWGTEYQRPGCGARFLGFLFRLLPKIGPLRALAFRPPTPEAEKLFLQSLDGSLGAYRRLLADTQGGELALEDRNLDTGKLTAPSVYYLCDRAVRSLLDKHAKEKNKYMTPELRQFITAYMKGWDVWPDVRENPGDWRDAPAQLAQLQSWQPVATGGTGPTSQQ